MNDIVNPFDEVKKRTNWAKKTQERLESSRRKKEVVVKDKDDGKKVGKVAKSFKIYPGKIPRDFDKRVNKLQVRFDKKDYDKEYVTSGKYLMFLMAFAEKYELWKLYDEVGVDGNLDVSRKKMKNYFEKMFEEKEN